MILDMHCHTKEGSPDGIVSIDTTIKLLREKGYDGMLVSDHNSYSGYKAIKKEYNNFLVLRGIEYDSLDAGHLLIILPSRMKYDIFEYKGIVAEDVVKIVHALGGIVGPAHPYDYFKLGLCNTKNRENVELLKSFDFIETFNACLTKKSYILSNALAEEYNKPTFGGSDSHHIGTVGLGKTILPCRINSEDDLIELVKHSDYNTFSVGGSFVQRKYEILFTAGITAGGFFYDVFNHCVSFNHTKKANTILDAINTVLEK